MMMSLICFKMHQKRKKKKKKEGSLSKCGHIWGSDQFEK